MPSSNANFLVKMVAFLLVEGGQYELERELNILSKSSSSWSNSVMGLERNFRSRSGTSSEIFGTGTELVPNSKIRNGTGTERPFSSDF